MDNDSYTEVTSQSWFSRLGNAFKGVVVGIILVIISFPLLFWNEGRAVKRYKTLVEGGGAVISVSATEIDPANENKLVHLSGEAITDEILTDEIFGLSVNALKLRRTVEMYQWQEDQRSEEKKKLGGGTETVTTYTYAKEWSPSLIDSSGFKKSSAHQNPGSMPYSSRNLKAQNVLLGAFTLSPSLLNMIRAYSPVILAKDYSLPDNLQQQAHIKKNSIYLGANPDSPQIGDTRVSFLEVKPLEISFIARQTNRTFEPYRAEAGGTIELLETGIHSAETMFQQAQQSNTILTWILRGVGLLVMFLGFRAILTPLSVFADVVPFFGSIVGAGSGLVSGLVALILSSLTVGIAWIVYRPLLAIVLFIVACSLGTLLFLVLRRKKPAPTASTA